jgi:hypothetical protein
MKHHLGTTFVVLTVFLLSVAYSLTGCTNGLNNASFPGISKTEVVGLSVGIAAVTATAIIVPVEISRSHHNIKGCVFAGPNGPELQTSDLKTYSLLGDAASLKVGDMVRFHGSKLKKTKSSTGEREFRVDKLSRDYGPCKSGRVARISGNN